MAEISSAARRELVVAVRARYQNSSKNEKIRNVQSYLPKQYQAEARRRLSVA